MAAEKELTKEDTTKSQKPVDNKQKPGQKGKKPSEEDELVTYAVWWVLVVTLVAVPRGSSIKAGP